MKFNAALLLLAHLLPAASAFSVPPVRAVRQETSSLHATTADSSNSNSNNGIDAAKALREKAAQLRAEIAALEGKSVDQVEQEAKDKKDQALHAKTASLEARKAPSRPVDYGKMMDVPTGAQDMVYQAARAVERAYADGIKRQTVRFALLAEGQGVQEMNEWPGGSAQMYREAGKPLTGELLREIRPNPNAVSAPNVKAQDIWDFDGSAIHYAEAKDSAKDDVQAMVFANTDVKYLRDIDAIDKDMGDRLFLLVNPFWRNVDSWGFNILAPGAKQQAQATIFDKGYDETYSLLRFSVRGEDCVALKAYPYDWQLYVYLENEMGWATPIRLGSSETEPKTDYVTDLINARPEFKLSKTMRQLSRGR
jgi:Domain of unknown function (DUF1995)